jgi:hypothetical protein
MRRTYTSQTTGRPIVVDDDDAYDAYKDGEIPHPIWGDPNDCDGPEDDEWIARAYEAQVPERRSGYYDGGRLRY